MKYLAITFSILLVACGKTEKKADAYGNFEAEERIVSAESTGKILELRLEEGQSLKSGQVVGRIDSAQIALKIAQLEAAIRAVAAKSPAIAAQLAVFDKQSEVASNTLAHLEREQKRLQDLLKNDAATPQQLDQLSDQVAQAKRQLELIAGQKAALEASLAVQKTGLLAEIAPLRQQVAQLEDQLAKCRITSPADGVVLAKYAEQGELAVVGKPLFKTAALDRMLLRAYLSGSQLTQVKLGQQVTVLVDGLDGALLEKPGTLTWVSSNAEFTPKSIQTRDERAHLVYAVQIAVENDGSLKIGMPAEVRF
jgi:HlyD family secretion protein